jgi:MFS family permease
MQADTVSGQSATPPTVSATPSVHSRRSELWHPQARAISAGFVILITLIAFENLGINTAMPKMAEELNGAELYSWPFTTYLVASMIANVLVGRLCDRRGPAMGVWLGGGLFLAGLIVAGLASSMPMLLVGRVLQGLGGGAQSVTIYVLISYVYPERAQPAVFGMLSTAWVLPSLIGPTVAGLLTERLTWRLVFLGLAPLVVLGLVLLLPAVLRLPATAPAKRTSGNGVAVAAVSAALAVAALSWAMQHPSSASLVLGALALVLLVPALRRLLPAGTLLGRQGLPATILARGLLAGAYTAVEVYVTLTLTSVHHFSPTLVGLPFTVGALAWSAGALIPARNPDAPRIGFIRWGFGFLATGIAALIPVSAGVVAGWFAMPAWLVASIGMGLAYSSISVLTLRESPEGERGSTASALQVCERLFEAMLVGVGGVLLVTVASPAHPAPAVVTLDVLMVAVAVLGAVVTRQRPRSAGKDAR